MKKIFLPFVVVSLLLLSCKKDEPVVQPEDIFECGKDIVDQDKNFYKTVEVGSKCWMATNLNRGTRINTDVPSSKEDIAVQKYCYDNDDKKCDEEGYGALYTWDELMNYSETEGASGICPNGFHVPTEAEFEALVLAFMAEGNALKKKGEDDTSTGTSGFDALLAGFFNENGSAGLTEVGSYHTSTLDQGLPVRISFFQNVTLITTLPGSKDTGLSVRCVK